MNLIRNLFIKLFRGQGVGAVLARGASQSLIVRVVGTGLMFLSQVLLARILDVQYFGDYIYVLTWINILVLLGIMGYNTASLRYIPRYQVEGDWGLLKGFLVRSQQCVLASSIVLLIIVILFAWVNQTSLGASLTTVFYVGAFLVPALSLLQLYGARLRGMKKVLSAQVPLQITHPLLVIVLVGSGYILTQSPLTGAQAMALNLFAVFLSLGISVSVFRRSLNPEICLAQPMFATKEWMHVAFPLLLISGMQMVMGQMDIIMLGAISGTEIAGIYSSAHRIATLVLLGLQAVNMMAAPMISELYHTGKIKELQRMVTVASWGIFTVTFTGSIILIVFGQWVLSFFGQAFVVAYIPLLLLLAGNIINALCGSVGFILNMTGNQKISGGIITSALIFNLLLNLLFIPRWGMAGAAIATAITMMYWNVFMCIIVIRKLKINPTIFQGVIKYEKT